jgi:hypothetical protein
MTLIRRLQDWCLFLMLVSSGTLAGAMGLIWLSARLGPLAPDPDATHPMEPVVIGLVMATAATGISYVLLEFAARLLPPARAFALRLRKALSRLSPRARLVWAVAALAVLGLVADLI